MLSLSAMTINGYVSKNYFLDCKSKLVYTFLFLVANSHTSNSFSSSLSQSVTQYQVVTTLSFCILSKTTLFTSKECSILFIWRRINLIQFLSFKKLLLGLLLSRQTFYVYQQDSVVVVKFLQ